MSLSPLPRYCHKHLSVFLHGHPIVQAFTQPLPDALVTNLMVFNTLSMASSILRSIVLMPNNLIDFFWGSADTLSAMVVDVLARKICWGLKRLFTALRSRRLMYQALQHHNRMEELALIHALSVWFLKFHRPSVSVLVGDDRDDSQQAFSPGPLFSYFIYSGLRGQNDRSKDDFFGSLAMIAISRNPPGPGPSSACR